jgi:hypothetical protein
MEWIIQELSSDMDIFSCILLIYFVKDHWIKHHSNPSTDQNIGNHAVFQIRQLQ